MSTISEVQHLTHSSVPEIATAAKQALKLFDSMQAGSISPSEFIELLDDVVKLDKIQQNMMAIEVYRLINQAYHTILTLKTLASL